MLAGGHLLTLPALEQDVLIIPEQSAFEALIGRDIEQYLTDHGIRTEESPLKYVLNVLDYHDMHEYYLQAEDYDLKKTDRADYYCLLFESETFSEDIGGDLEEIERRHPGLGAWLLLMMEKSPFKIMTPHVMYEEPELFFGDGWDADPEHDPEAILTEDEGITRDIFEAYYPAWAYEMYDDPEPDISPWPQLCELRKAFDHYVSVLTKFGDKFNEEFIDLDGEEMYSGCICWTRGRHEVERDIGYRACNEFFQMLQYNNGAVSGCVKFEFLLNSENAERNRGLVKLLDSFLTYLKLFDRVIDDIEKGVFR